MFVIFSKRRSQAAELSTSSKVAYDAVKVCRIVNLKAVASVTCVLICKANHVCFRSNVSGRHVDSLLIHFFCTNRTLHETSYANVCQVVWTFRACADQYCLYGCAFSCVSVCPRSPSVDYGRRERTVICVGKRTERNWILLEAGHLSTDAERLSPYRRVHATCCYRKIDKEGRQVAHHAIEIFVIYEHGVVSGGAHVLPRRSARREWVVKYFARRHGSKAR